MLGQAGRFMKGGFSLARAGEAEAASILSFGGTVAGFALGWTSLAAELVSFHFLSLRQILTFLFPLFQLHRQFPRGHSRLEGLLLDLHRTQHSHDLPRMPRSSHAQYFRRETHLGGRLQER